MSSNAPPARVSEADYDAIEEAVMETARGRWFLSEYARRNRATDTASVLAALGRLEEMTGPLEGTFESSNLVDPLLTMIEDARATPWQGAIDPDNRALQLRPSQASKSATAAVRSTAEKIREVAFELRETAKLEIYANALDLYCVDLTNAALLQESATSRLTEISALVMEIETQLTGNPNSAASTPLPKDPASVGSNTANNQDAPIAPDEFPESSTDSIASTHGRDNGVALSATKQSPDADKGHASALLFVSPR
jgi:hypothetical protein